MKHENHIEITDEFQTGPIDEAFDARTPEEREADILNHQARIDMARNHGRLLDPEERDAIRDTYLWQPGYEKTARAVRLGVGDYRKRSELPRPDYTFCR